MSKKILIICTSANRMGSASDAAETGSWMEEVAAPYYVWKEKGYEVTITSLKGGEVPFDEGSLNPPFLTKEAEKFMLDNDAMSKVTNSLKLSEVDASSFDAVFLPGGHGTCYDLPESEVSTWIGTIYDLPESEVSTWIGTIYDLPESEVSTWIGTIYDLPESEVSTWIGTIYDLPESEVSTWIGTIYDLPESEVSTWIGTIYDLPESEELSKQLSAAWNAGKVVSAVCHGPTGLVNVKDANGAPIVKGRKVTGFSDSEEVAVGKDHLVPFMLETKLKELGGVYECAANWQVHAVRDGNLVTGQNPGSSARTAELVVEALSA
ncbi:hypothetical protein CEUSTIGMA_g13078.t1 [Chlamydomonas eustigma]|uniref:DJ-1/PfpI domain-containing protein n=1 Tax=Chlamydomonas eustigma TaxID=1157962 RepID=A0A250XRM8_9CHLO|nr:hypothetical protein CEUSTIGMA_g13078.t1 [Chlamydomonas eustigma]|eukprot:GAX85663.1 hypothetical protein CEUSTIGMA_g13078.t1 [Chlamydomonas eustigma]